MFSVRLGIFYLGKTDYLQSMVFGFSLAFADKLLTVTKLLYESDTDTQEPGRWSVNHSICSLWLSQQGTQIPLLCKESIVLVREAQPQGHPSVCLLSR